MGHAFLFFADIAAGFAFVAAAILFALRGRHSWPNALFALALLLTGCWALTVAFVGPDYAEFDQLTSIFAALRDAGWFAAILALLQHESERQPLWRRLAIAAGILFLANLAFALSNTVVNTGLGLRLSLAVVQLAVSIMGLILIENLALNIGPARSWSVRLMVIGLTALFGYNIVLRIPQFLGGRAYRRPTRRPTSRLLDGLTTVGGDRRTE